MKPNAVGVGVGALDWTAVLEGTPKKHELLKANDHESEEASQQAFLEDCGVSHGFHHPSWTTSRLPPLAKTEVSSLSLTLFQPTTKHTLLLKRSQEPRPATTKKLRDLHDQALRLKAATKRSRSSPSRQTNFTKWVQEASKAKRCTRTSFSHSALSQRKFTALTVKLEAFSTA